MNNFSQIQLINLILCWRKSNALILKYPLNDHVLTYDKNKLSLFCNIISGFKLPINVKLTQFHQKPDSKEC